MSNDWLVITFNSVVQLIAFDHCDVLLPFNVFGKVPPGGERSTYLKRTLYKKLRPSSTLKIFDKVCVLINIVWPLCTLVPLSVCITFLEYSVPLQSTNHWLSEWVNNTILWYSESRHLKCNWPRAVCGQHKLVLRKTFAKVH